MSEKPITPNNPMSLLELRDSLGLLAESLRQEAEANQAQNPLGALSLFARRQAFLDVRATIEGMISNERARLDADLAALREAKRPVCDACGGEGVIGGLLVGDDVVDETCWTCGGKGVL